MTKGDIVLITFPFTDLTGQKLRPGIVLASTNLDLTVRFITTQTQQKENTDMELIPSTINGIRKHSLVRTSKIATLDKKLAKGLLGKLTINEISELNNNLKKLLDLN